MSDISRIQTPFNEGATFQYALILFKSVAEGVVDAMGNFPPDEQEKMMAALDGGLALAERSPDLLWAAMVKRESDWERARLTLLKRNSGTTEYADLHTLIETFVSTGLAP